MHGCGLQRKSGPQSAGSRLEQQIGAALRSENSPRAGALKALVDVKVVIMAVNE